MKHRECGQCKNERNRRNRVINEEDKRPYEDKFKTAPLIVPNNDVKYKVNKDRAVEWAREHGCAVLWSAAKDSVKGSPSFTRNPNLLTEKRKWLNYTDAQCGGLSGMVPVVLGMEVVATDHLCRGDYEVLKGDKGQIVGYELHTEDKRASDHVFEGHVPLRHPPSVVFVKFNDKKWTIKMETKPGVHVELEPGVYPVVPKTTSWSLAYAATTTISRHQLPLNPAFARTAYSMQGSTLPAAIVDVNVPTGTDLLTCYVAISRVKRADDLLILRRFPICFFHVPDHTAPQQVLILTLTLALTLTQSSPQAQP